MFDDFRVEAVKILKNANVKSVAQFLEEPPNPKMGDLAFPCFSLSKERGKNPNEVSKEIAGKVDVKGSVFKEVKVMGPYVNFFFDKGKLAEKVIKAVKKEKYGSDKSKESVMVEFPAPNTNKPLHLGHMRNMAIGEALSRIFEKLGYKVFRVNLHNDRGIHICKSMLAYQKWGNGVKPKKKSDHFVGDFYVMFSQKVKEKPGLEEEAKKMLKKWEEGDKETRELWKKMNSWVESGFKETYKRFGVEFDRIYKESEMYEKGKEMVLEGLGRGIFKKDDTDAIYFDLSKHGLDKKFLIRADGTTLYITQDLYLAFLKYKDFKMNRSVYVVANEQNYHFDILFKLLEELKKLDYKFAEENVHLNYGMVSLPSGKMKSREGMVVDADNLMDDLKESVKKEIEKRNELENKKLEGLSNKISLSAIKFFLLKYDEYKDFIFRPEESISFEGETGPYLQYSLVRANKILDKSKEKPSLERLNLLKDEEFELVKKIATFKEVLEDAATKYKPHLVANYAYELASLFSKFYESCPVIRSEQEKERLALVESFIYIMRNCLELMGIDEVELM